MKGKKFLSLLIVSLLFVCFFQGKKVEAAKGDLAGEKKSDYAYAINDMYKKELLSGVMLYKQQVKTLKNGQGSVWNSTTVQWVDVPASSDDVRVVVWTMSDKHGWDSGLVRHIAKDYEETHPGWIVLAGINGDFFNINGTGEPTNISVQEGEVHQPHAINDVNYRAGLGIVENDFTNYIYGEVSLDSELSIEVIKNGVVVNTKQASKINSSLSETGINVLTIANKEKVDLTGYKVVAVNYDINRSFHENTKKIFVKGTVAQTENLGEIVEVPRGKFYLASKDGSLDDFVETGDYVRCQYKLTNQWSNVTDAIGYVYQVMNNGSVLHQGASGSSYAGTPNPHTYIGFKEDGSVVMMVNDGRGNHIDCKESITLFEGGELLRLAGCKTAFNLDGGGSSTLVVRNERGALEVVNRPSDNNERADGNAILVVAKDPGIQFYGQEITRNSVVFTRKINEQTEKFKNITLKINGVIHNFTQERLEITGLEENTEYEVEFAYESQSLKDETKYIKRKTKVVVKTKQFIAPASGLDVTEVGKNSIKISKLETDYSSWIQNVTVYVSGTPYYMGNESTFIIEDLMDTTKYEIIFSYNVVEPGNPKVYTFKDDAFNITTLSFNLPVFEKLEIAESTENSIKVSYQYDDEDRIIEEIYIVIYGQNGKEVTKQKIDKKRGTVEFTGLDLTSQQYKVKFKVLYYENEEDTLLSEYYSQVVKTEIIEKQQEPVKKKTCKKTTGEYLIATLSVASLAILLFRRKK